MIGTLAPMMFIFDDEHEDEGYKKTKIDTYCDYGTIDKMLKQPEPKKYNIWVIMIWIIAGTLCAYYSWQSNSFLDWPKHWKVIFACGAFAFPYYYVAIHVFGKLDMMNYITHKCTKPKK